MSGELLFALIVLWVFSFASMTVTGQIIRDGGNKKLGAFMMLSAFLGPITIAALVCLGLFGLIIKVITTIPELFRDLSK